MQLLTAEWTTPPLALSSRDPIQSVLLPSDVEDVPIFYDKEALVGCSLPSKSPDCNEGEFGDRAARRMAENVQVLPEPGHVWREGNPVIYHVLLTQG